MLKFFIAVLFGMSSSVYALNIDKACEEHQEQKQALLSNLSTSYIEANMAGQCIGYREIQKGNGIKLKEYCSEFIEQKENLLGRMSTSLTEANMAGQCIGAIYAVCKDINYTRAAKNIISNSNDSLTMSRSNIQSYLRCYD
ncbi:hypothetical protein O1D97_12165 [Marinomonas sp. 15G1-11]|uniref:Uncharacterized protein n=1 Tax=Marinomonas phaeophyticola TaxID=3004091 RepID=A0ABT4JVJ0_9GAMM|nr:hypothetical protein [Marinomonas sp. 15G1-11]MCZ2722360.1 hypothetical protein [Marinomonas sp. 15G1-11]